MQLLTTDIMITNRDHARLVALFVPRPMSPPVCFLIEVSVLYELLVHLLHSLDVRATRYRVVHHGQRVVLADHAFRRLLHVFRRSPRLVYVLSWHVLQDR